MKISLIFLLGILISQLTFGQENPDLNPSSLSRIGEVLPPSPNAASLGKYGGVPINHSSGKPNVNVPLYEIRTPNLTVPISLSYSTSGYKVNEVASRVGLSWSLNFGGVITRTVFDAPDEVWPREAVPSGFGALSNMDIYNYLIGHEQSAFDIADCQHDIFAFNFGGYSGRFIIDNGNVVLLENQNMQIRTSLIETNYIDGCSFKIITPDGIAWYFGGSNATEYSGSESFGINCGGEKDFNMIQTAWYLKKIMHPNGDAIDFTYSDVNFNYLASISQSETRSIKGTSRIYSCLNGAPMRETNTTCITEQIIQGVRLDRVTTSNGQNLDIEYQTREDLPGDYLIKSIVIYKSNSTSQIFKKVNLSYEISTSIDYTNDYNNSDALKKHVFLHSVTEVDANGSSLNGRYVFEYNSISELPPRLSFAQDYWGFFNGKYNQTLVYIRPEDEIINNNTQLFNLFNAGANRNSDAIYAQKGLLKKIIYPTGGADEIVYESHQHSVFEEYGNNTPINVSRSVINDNDITQKYDEIIITPNLTQDVQINILCNYFGTGSYDPPADRVDFEIIDMGTNHSLVGVITLVAGNNNPNEWNNIVNLAANHTYKLAMTVYGQDVVSIASFTYQQTNVVSQWVTKSEGGVRVKEIRSFDYNNTENVKRYFYAYRDDLTTPSCDVAAYTFPNLTKSLTVVFATCSFCGHSEIENYTLSSSSYTNIGLFSGSPISYKSVIESHGENFENGAIEYIYDMEVDGGIERVYGVSPLATPYSSSGFWNGLLRAKRILQKTPTGWTTKEEESYHYNTDNRVVEDYDDYTIRQNFDIACNQAESVNFVNPDANIATFDVYKYQIRRRWIYPNKITTTKYAQDGSMAVTVEKENVHLHVFNIRPSLTTSTTSITDEKVSKSITYAQDLFTTIQPQWLTNLKDAGFVEAQIEELIIKKINNIDYVTSGQLIIYDDVSIKPSQTFVLRLSEPIMLSQFNRCAVENGAFSYDPRYEKSIALSYDAVYANLAEAKKEGFEKSYLWGYNNSWPVAEILGASVKNVFYTSFEEAEGNAVNGDAKTGINSRIGGYLKQLSGLANGNYMLSWWEKSGAGWVFQKSTVIVTSNSYAISLPGQVDEVRFFPEGALMTTFTYEPLIGFTSQTDPTNNTIYYEYDGFGRLFLVRDRDKNILKRICYNYTGQPEDCVLNANPSWTLTGNTRCKPCPDNTSYISNIGQVEERDTNPLSSTYNQTRWTDNGVNSNCTVNPDWQFTSTQIRCRVVNGVNTGEQEREQMDMRPCSVTYGQTKWVVTGTNTTACPLPCTTANCSGQGFKCINNICEEGIRVCTHSVPVAGGMYRTYFHYEFSDGSWSADYSEVGPFMCANNP